MKTKHLLFAVMIFVLAFTAACGGAAEPTPATADPVVEAPTDVPTEQPATEEPTAVMEPTAEEVPTEAPTEVPTEAPVVEAPVEAPEFLLPDDASNVIVVGEGVTTFQTALSMPDVITFYRFGFLEYIERESLTEFSEDSFQIIFDGHESGKSVIVQGFPLADGVVSVSIRLGDA